MELYRLSFIDINSVNKYLVKLFRESEDDIYIYWLIEYYLIAKRETIKNINLSHPPLRQVVGRKDNRERKIER